MTFSRRGFFSKALGACVGIVAVPEVARVLPKWGSTGGAIQGIIGGLPAYVPGDPPTLMGYPIRFVSYDLVEASEVKFGDFGTRTGETVEFTGVWDDVEDPEFAAKALLED